MKFVWIGPRESDIKYTRDFFTASVTLYGNSDNNNHSFSTTKKYRINHNNITDDQTVFMNETELALLNEKEDIRFMSYNPSLMEQCDERIRNNTVCYNNQELLNFLSSKINFRQLSQDVVPTLHSEYCKGGKFDFESIKRLFPNSDRYVVQADIASGGYGTHILDKSNYLQVLSSLTANDTYLISPYYENNIPINIHAIIYENDILIFPASVQIMIEDANRLLYRGADYVAYNSIATELKEEFRDNTMKICSILKDMGYRGVLGLDAMIVNNEVLMLELNNRFQASTIALNKALFEANQKSIQELNYEAFTGFKPSISNETLYKLSVGYSCFTYIKESDSIYINHLNSILPKLKKSKNVSDILFDGYNGDCINVEDEAYLFRVIFKTNIVSISADQQVALHPNIASPSRNWYFDIVEKRDFIKLKISLLNQGVILTDTAKEHLAKNGGMQEGVYCSVDLIVDNMYTVNSPLYVKFCELTPLWVDYNDKCDKLLLHYYNNELYDVDIDPFDDISNKITSSGIPVGAICLKATDRLRIQNSPFCTFKENDIPCKFCEAQYKKFDFNIDDILEAVGMYFDFKKDAFRHILIGGLSNNIGLEKHIILQICKFIRKNTNMNIYLMCLPPRNLDDINEYVAAGVTEVAFNIEIFDRKLAKKLMPGKGNIPLSTYLSALERSVQLLGANNSVRTAFVVGLESIESILEGIESVCRIGVSPILSVFRPIPGTEMENQIIPSNEYLYDLYIRAKMICEKYNLELGPSCAYCQNNTLALKRIQ